MKKKIAIVMAAAMALTMAGCSVSTTSKAPAGTTAQTTESASETAAGSSEAADSAGAAKGDAAETTEAAAATDYPNKPINMIIPYGAGGTTDVYGRTLAALLEKQLGQPITVTNQGGASGSIGSQYVKDQASDGYTLLVCAETMGTYRTMGTSELGYDDFTIVAPLVGDPKVVVVGKDSKYNTLQELLDDIKANPGKITMSHSGPGGSGHNQGLVLGELGYDVAMTSFDSGNAALLGVIGGQVDFTNPNISTLQSYIESGEVKALAVFSSERMEAYPDIPAFTETVPEAEKYLDIPYTALTFCVNNDTPKEVVDVLKDAAQKVFADPEWTEFVETNAAEKLYEKYTTDEEIKAFYDKCQSVICWLQYDNGVAPNSPDQYGIERMAE
ncbi:tripartite tricarboxylate transporter substrate binding protein [Clostridium sp. AN503]|uniref:Bug family tripartite tricarboxylate transporter substrate binding protein n=1 Tax=Clostridium sp. AN503 TaxID=3160598 RepID=UPI0034595750